MKIFLSHYLQKHFKKKMKWKREIYFSISIISFYHLIIYHLILPSHLIQPSHHQPSHFYLPYDLFHSTITYPKISWDGSRDGDEDEKWDVVWDDWEEEFPILKRRKNMKWSLIFHITCWSSTIFWIWSWRRWRRWRRMRRL